MSTNENEGGDGISLKVGDTVCIAVDAVQWKEIPIADPAGTIVLEVVQATIEPTGVGSSDNDSAVLTIVGKRAGEHEYFRDRRYVCNITELSQLEICTS